jgi:outer membrane lipoprotein-sorting protein
MKRLLCIPALFLAAAAPTLGGELTVKSALKQMDRATKDLQGVTARMRWDQQVGTQTISGSGTIYVDFGGRVRAEIGGGNPRTILAIPSFLYRYSPLEEKVELFYTPENPHLLGQYALLGWMPTGNALKKKYKVELTRLDTLDTGPAAVLSLVPKSKELARVISVILIWVDQATWLPAKQLIRHQEGTSVEIHYLDTSPDDVPPEERFRPNWPAGTRLVEK